MESPSCILDFINQYKVCPKCGGGMHFEARERDSYTSNKYEVLLDENKLKISISSDFFVEPKKKVFEFSISLIDGFIYYPNQTNEFVSLYDLDIFLYKYCIACPELSPPEAFSQIINIYYDRQDSIFKAKPIVEFFSFSFEDSYYYFSSSFETMRSVLMINSKLNVFNGVGEDKKVLHTTYIPFEKFYFGDKSVLFSKINNIMVLA